MSDIIEYKKFIKWRKLKGFKAPAPSLECFIVAAKFFKEKNYKNEPKTIQKKP